MVADYLAEHWAGKEIAILDDGTTWGAGVADGARRRLQERGVTLALDETITPGEEEYSALVSKMQAAGVEVSLPRRLPPRGRPDLPPGARPGLRPPADRQQCDGARGFPDDRGSGARRHDHGRHDRHARSPRGGGGRGAIPRAGLRAARLRPFTLRRDPGLGPGGRGGGLAGPGRGYRQSCTAASSTRCWAGSVSTPRATSRASSRGNGSSGRRTAPTCRWSKAWPRNSEGKPDRERQIFRIAARRARAQNIFHRLEG